MFDQKLLLSGLKVIDAGSFIAGPVSTTILSDFGAEVAMFRCCGPLYLASVFESALCLRSLNVPLRCADLLHCNVTQGC